MTTEIIDKGVRLCCEKTNRFKTAVVSVSMAMPMSGGVAARAVLIHLLHRTNSKYPTVTALNRKLAQMYGARISPSVTKVGEAQILKLTLTAVDDRFSLHGESICKECIELLCDCIFKPVLENNCFREEDVEREKRLLIELIESERDDKRLYAMNRCEEEMCRDEAYGLSKYGTPEQVEALSARDVFEEWTKVLLNCCVQINMIGSAEPSLAADILKPIFSKIGRTDIVELKTEFITSAYESRTVEETQTLKQSKLVIGLRAGMTYDMDNLPAILVMNDIFGGGVYSKLFLNVREKQSLCYYCWSRLNRNKGIILIQCGVETENIDKAIGSIRSELDDMRAGRFDENVIEASKLSIRDTYMSAYDSPETLDRWYSNQLASGSLISPAELAEMTKDVSREEMILAANEITEDTVYVLKAAPSAE